MIRLQKRYKLVDYCIVYVIHKNYVELNQAKIVNFLSERAEIAAFYFKAR